MEAEQISKPFLCTYVSSGGPGAFFHLTGTETPQDVLMFILQMWKLRLTEVKHRLKV